MLALSYANYPLWWAAWLAPTPAVAAVLLAPPRLRVAVGLVVGLLSSALSFGYHVTTGSATAAIVIAIAYALAWSSTLRLARTAAERRPALVATLVLPTAWAAIDTLLIHISPHAASAASPTLKRACCPCCRSPALGECRP